ncbi:U1 small nuclear ribonucleoprotein C [Plasmodium coatneyi]|uniref:U1 small nuclear ribonucleoprotein C n=1 Tax=Plasmodium coatneyi TaxID=208452 RepID=A0A1B1E4M9_9APIC|nr:U1 small nuclear ribonucleoprotein C [Plasmodium coatneyi]ANQ09973.1 U1 small nuclear ribonucleoprotein C [Plasmodium coatneyi]
MPKYYCEYCDIYLTHSSPVGRRQHIQGRKHISAKIEYFQNLLREEGITPQNFLGFLGPRALNNILGNPMMNNMMPGNYPMHTKYNNMKHHSHYSRRSHRHHMSHGRYPRERHGHYSYSSKFHSHPMHMNNSNMGGMPGFPYSDHSGGLLPSPNSMHGHGKMGNLVIRDLVSNVNIDNDPSRDSQNEERNGDHPTGNPRSGMHNQGDHPDVVNGSGGAANNNDNVTVDA